MKKKERTNTQGEKSSFKEDQQPAEDVGMVETSALSSTVEIIPIASESLSAKYRDMYRKKDKVAIVGFADSWNQTPFNDSSFDIWGLNSLFEIIPRWDLWFETHDKKGWENNKEIGLGLTRNGRPYKEGLAGLNVPVFMVDKYEDVPNSIRYPLEEMLVKFDPIQRRTEWKEYGFQGSVKEDWNGYFTNSISYMIAMAIDWGYPEIHIYGVDMATTGGGEYASQRPSCEYYIGVAVGRGIKVYIPPQADLLKCRFLYGWEEEKRSNYQLKIQKLVESMNQRFGSAQQDFELARKKMDQYIGAIEAIRETEKIWSNCAG